MNKRILSLGLWLSAVLSLSAQQRLSSYEDKKTDKWSVRIFGNDPLNVRVYTLNNGLTVITSVNKEQPRINTMIAVKTGSKNDPAQNTGLAHYLEHMLFKGTDQYGSLNWEKERPLLEQIDMLYNQYNKTTDDNLRKNIYHQIDSVSQLAAKFAIANEYDKMCQSMGATGTNAFTSNEMTVYVNDIPSNMLHKWITLEAERYRSPVLRLFHTELEAVYEEKNISLDRDGSKVNELLMEKLFAKHNYGQQTTIGTIEHLKNPSLQAIRDYYKKYYVPNNMAVILCGDFDPDAAVDGIAEHFAYMQPSAVPEYKYDYEMIHAAPQEYQVSGPDAEWVTIGYRLPGAGTREARAAKIIDLLLNNASAGLIDLNLVKQQKVLSANSGVNVLNDYSVFMLTGKPREGQSLKEVRDLLIGQMKLIQEGKFDDQMLKAIILNEEINRIKGFKDNQNRAYFLMEMFVQNSTYMKQFNELYEMSRTKKDEIVEIAREYLNMDRVEVFKVKGEPAVANKIIKPEIHPVELNRDKQSSFVTEWLAEETEAIQPVYPDFKTQIKESNVGPAKMYYVKNTGNRLFDITWRLHYGRFHNKALPTAMEYLKLVGFPGVSADSFSRAMYNLGCSFSSSAADRYSYLTLSGPEENFDKALELVNQLLTNCVADVTALDNLKGTIAKRRTDNKLNSRSIASVLNNYVLYGKNNPANYVLSTQELAALKAGDLINIIHALGNKPQDISYYGQREEAAVAGTLKSKTKIPAAFEKVNAPVVFNLVPNTEAQVWFVNYKQRQASIYWHRTGDVYNAQEDPKIDVFNQYFGGDMSSVVFQNIREAKALAYSTFASYIQPDQKDKNGRVLAFIGTQADKFNDAVNAMNELLSKLPEDTAAFSFSKSSIKNRIETERISEEGLVNYLWSMQEYGLDKDSRELLYNTLKDIKLKDIIAFHKAMLNAKNYRMAIVADKENIKPADLKKYGKVTELTLEEIFGY